MNEFAHNMICVIPARAGSKRFPGKNLAVLAGKPLVAHTIITALESKLFEKVYVATESKEIADVAEKYGATVPTFVPANLCGDENPSWDSCVYLVDYVNKTLGKDFKNLLCLQPTSPLRNVDDIKGAVKAFGEGKFDFLVSVTPIDPHFFHWAMIENKKGEKSEWEMYFRKKYLNNKPDSFPTFRPNGAIKIANIEKLMVEKSFFGLNLGVVHMSDSRALHIINPTDLIIAEALLK
ncbi:MAG: acylneuraminate cytidylyltransferase family protein [Candidatus Taylorbacteria bacterium]|nr:acylneuraminate cytidylyltransferase family protein [Candidatus Taylorbacteria bacterium]